MTKNPFLKLAFTGGIAFISLVCQFARADRLDQMASPLTNPTTFEDPRIITNVQPIFMYHEISSDFMTDGGHFQYYGLQGRFAVDTHLALTLTKFGIISFSPEDNLSSHTGLTDVSFGAKYAVFQDTHLGRVWSAGIRYEAPTGSTDAYQGRGKGILNPYTSAGLALTDHVNLLGNTGLRIGTDDEDSSFWDTNVHTDWNLGSFIPLVEMNFVQSISNGNRFDSSSEGADMFNFGATSAAGRMLITAGVGARYRFTRSLDAGLGYQFPISNSGSDFFDWRITGDLIVSF